MKKKIILTLLCLLCLFSCGKKGDPEYNEPKSEVTNTKLLMVS